MNTGASASKNHRPLGVTADEFDQLRRDAVVSLTKLR